MNLSMMMTIDRHHTHLTVGRGRRSDGGLVVPGGDDGAGGVARYGVEAVVAGAAAAEDPPRAPVLDPPQHGVGGCPAAGYVDVRRWGGLVSRLGQREQVWERVWPATQMFQTDQRQRISSHKEQRFGREKKERGRTRALIEETA